MTNENNFDENKVNLTFKKKATFVKTVSMREDENQGEKTLESKGSRNDVKETSQDRFSMFTTPQKQD